MPARGLAALCAAALLAGCGSMIASAPLIGEPPEAQNRPAVQPAYPSVAGPGADALAKPMTPAERAKLEAELVAARDKSAAEKRQQINETPAR